MLRLRSRTYKTLTLAYVILLVANLTVIGAKHRLGTGEPSTFLHADLNGIPMRFTLEDTSLSVTEAVARLQNTPGVIMLGDGTAFYRELTEISFMQHYPCALLDCIVLEKNNLLELHAFLAKADGGCHHLSCLLPASTNEWTAACLPRPATGPFKDAVRVFKASIPGLSIRQLNIPHPLAESRSLIKNNLLRHGASHDPAAGLADVLVFYSSKKSYLVTFQGSVNDKTTGVTVLEMAQ